MEVFASYQNFAKSFAGECGFVRAGAGGCGCGLARVRVEAGERGEPCSCYRPPELPLLLGAGTV